jgi:hypothetical protein
MATAGVPLWSTTAASNATADPAVNWAEGMAPSAVNDSARAMMASVAKWRDDFYGITTAGSSTAYTISTGSTFATAAAMSGAIFTILPHATSGAVPTLAVDGLTARAINQSTGVAVATGALISGTPYQVKYVHATTEFILLGRSSVFTTLQTTGILTQSSTSHGIIAAGTTGQRPAAVAAGFRYNSTTGAPEFSDGVSWLPLLYTLSGAQLPYGGVINGTIDESRAGNAVTFALKTLAGSDPSAGDPVLLAFRSSSLTNGSYVYRTVTSALSLTISSGSTLGTSDGVPFKVWLVLFDDAGTIRLGAIQCRIGATTPELYPLGQLPRASSTAEGGVGGADSAGVFYTGTAVTNKAYVILGYAAYESGLATAGAWASQPRQQLFGPGVPLPGSTVQSVYSSTTSTTANSSTTKTATSLTGTITVNSATNLVKVQAYGQAQQSTGNILLATLWRGTGSTQIGNISPISSNTANGPIALFALDFPQAAGSTQYGVYIQQNTGSNTGTFLNTNSSIPTNSGTMMIDEIMT